MKAPLRKSITGLALALFGFSAVPAQTLKDAIKMTANERYEAASTAFKKVLKGGDDMNGDAWFYYGDNFLEWGVLDSAKMMFQKGADAKPSNPLNFVGLGSVAWKENNADGAKQNFYKATSLTSTQVKELPKDKQAMVYLKIAECYIQSAKKNLTEAYTDINLALKVDSKNPEVYIQLGDYWVEKNVTDVSEAIKSYEKATELDKTSTRALLRQGQMWVRVQNYEDGLKFYKQAIQLDSTFAPAYRYRGDLYLKYARYKQAIADFRKYLSMNDSPSAREQYIRALFNSKNYKDGIEEMKTLMKRDSVNPYMIRLEAYLYYETGDYAKGISAMENFLKKQKVNDKPKLMVLDYSYYGKLLSKNGSDSLGILQIKRAIELDPMSPDAYGDIAAIYFKGKRFADAAAYYELKIKNSPKVNVLDYSSLGQAYYSNKEYVKADTAFTHILAAYPVYGNAWRGRANYKQENQEKPEGKAKPFYELAICKAGTDIERNKKDLIEAYSYLGFYYFVQKNYACSKQAWMKVQEIDATNEKAKSAMEDKNIKATTGSCELIKCL